MALPLLTLPLRTGPTLWTRSLISLQMELRAGQHLMQWLAALPPSSC